MSAGNKLLQAAAGVGGAEDTDPDFANAVLLLNGDDAPNGGQNNTFLDSSSNTHTITRNGNTTQGSFSPFSVDDGKWGVYFDGSSEIQTDSTINIGTSNFTVEFWVNWDGQDTNASFVATNGTSGSSWVVRLASSDLVFRKASTTDITTTHTMEVGVWTHVAVVREGTGTNQVKIYVNGVNVGEGTATNDYGTRKINIGAGRGSAPNDVGHLSNVRLVVGSAVYTAGFTPSTTPLTDITNTKLLTCQSNRLVDNSSIGDTFTLTGTPKVTPFSPFPQTTAYDASTNGGSGYFDGTSGTYLTASDATDFDFGTGDFTVECWFYEESLVGSFVILGATEGVNQYWAYGDIFGGGMTMYAGVSGSEIYSGSANTPVSNQWNHLVWQRESGVASMYINGERVYNAAYTVDFGSSATGFRIGRSSNYNNYYTNGNISNFRIVKGSAVYSGASFTPPTAPLTPTIGASLLTNFTNASIYDATGKNILETVGNAQVDTTTVKYGTGAMEFDGTGDYLEIPYSDSFHIGTGDYTAECWAYITSHGEIIGAFDGTTAPFSGWLFSTDFGTSGKLNVFFAPETGSYPTNTQTISSSANVPTNTWTHLAFSKEGTTIRLFIDGSLDTTTTLNMNTSVDVGPSNYPILIGAGSNPTPNRFLTGFIDDLRITKGIARYTANFTPPTKALPVIGE